VRPAGVGGSLAGQLPPARARFQAAGFALVGGRLRTLPAVLRRAAGSGLGQPGRDAPAVEGLVLSRGRQRAGWG